MKTSDETLIKALRILALDIQCEDGAANACVAEAAARIEEKSRLIQDLILIGDELRLYALEHDAGVSEQFADQWLSIRNRAFKPATPQPSAQPASAGGEEGE